jgi:hypothetical protein
MRLVHAGVVALALALAPAAGAQPSTPAAHAVVVGISGYPAVRPGLQFADDDAEAFSRFLRTPRGGGFTVTLLTNEQATRAAIFHALHDVAGRVDVGDIVYVFFAGHSVVGADGVAYLMPYDGDETLPVASGITAAGFLAQISSLYGQASRVVVFVDACRSGALMDPQGLASRGGEDINQALTAVWTRESALMNANEQRLVMGFFSAQARQDSYEHASLGHGLFTHYLLRGLEGEADGFSPSSPERDGIVRAFELRDFLQSNVSRHARNLFTRPQDPVASPVFDRDFAMATTGAGGRHAWTLPTAPVPRVRGPLQATAPRRAPVDGELLLRTGETTPVGDLRTFFGVWDADVGARPTDGDVSVRLNGEPGGLLAGESFEFTHSRGACRIRYVGSADPDPAVREDEVHRFSLVCRPRGAARWPPPLRHANPAWEPDVWLRVGQTMRLAEGRNYFGVLGWGVGINVWRTQIAVALNGESTGLWAGDRLEVREGGRTCYISYLRTNDPDIRVEGDEHHGFGVLCDGASEAAAPGDKAASSDADLWLRTGQTVRLGDSQHFFGVRSWGWGINIDTTSIQVALDNEGHWLRAGSRLEFTTSSGTCYVSYMGSEDPDPERQGDERHGFALACPDGGKH